MQASYKLVILFIFLVTIFLSTYFFSRSLIFEQKFYQASLVTPTPQLSEKLLGTSTKNFEQSFKVTKVIDGDTIEIDYLGQPKKLRYIGINTPETVDPRRPVQCFGKEASNENKSLLEGKEVFLEKDISDVDKFGRLLRYVYLKLDDGSLVFINDYLVREGFAQIETVPPDMKYTERFLTAQEQARQNQKGLWGKCSQSK